MYRQGSRSLTAPSRATATTLCQKCLQKGHYSYECTATAQQRPYSARPSRTQQLLNPKLVPALTSEVPQELFKKKGQADEQLAQAAQKRGRKPYREVLDEAGNDAKAMRRSTSMSSTTSVSTISTNLSPSPSPEKSKSAPARKQGYSRDGALAATRHTRQSHERARSDSQSTSGYSSTASDRKVLRAARIPKGSRRRGLHDSAQADSESKSQSRRSRSPAPERRRTTPQEHNSRPRLRSMSPYSKRIALTQAMNG